MSITIKRMETDEEIRGKAFVHWQAWHEAYTDLVSPDYLDKLTLEKCEKMAFSWTENTMVAKDGDRVLGFVSWGDRGEEAPGIGEIFGMRCRSSMPETERTPPANAYSAPVALPNSSDERPTFSSIRSTVSNGVI